MRVWKSNVDDHVLVELEPGADAVSVPCLHIQRKKIPEIIQALQEAQALLDANQSKTLMLPHET